MLKGGGLSVLIVDGDLGDRGILRYMLGELGITNLHEASCSRDALAQLSRRPFGLILAGGALGEMDGLALLGAVRNQPTTANVPFVILSDAALPQEVAKARSLGVTDYLLRPLDTATLAARLRVALGPVV